MKKIYVVTTGEYSDYGIEGIFTTRKRAQEFMAQVASTHYNDIEVYDLDATSIMGPLSRGLCPWSVIMLRDGSTETVRQEEADTYVVARIGTIRIWRRSTAPAFKGENIPDALEGTVWAKGAKHAVKIFNEKRAQMIASGQWP